MTNGRPKTYWHLGAQRRLPTEYEIATSRLLYPVGQGSPGLALLTSRFTASHAASSRLRCRRWEDFTDPRATTYAKYVAIAHERERYLGRLLATLEETEADRRWPAAWIDLLLRVLSPLRFAAHGLQMAAAYVAHLAPSGRIAVAGLFQCADELRRVQRIAYRVALLRKVRPDADEIGRSAWQSDPAWQGLRAVVERLLVTYDWGEALVGLNVCLKPAVDHLLLIEVAALAEQNGDPLDGQMLRSLFEDCAWHRDWTEAVLQLVFSDEPTNRDLLLAWMDAWSPAVGEAVSALANALGADTGAAADRARGCLLVWRDRVLREDGRVAHG